MCYHFSIKAKPDKVTKRFNADFDFTILLEQEQVYNGFAYPQTPIITNHPPKIISSYHWGLLPAWANDTTIRKNTLNARTETIREKPAFRDSVDNRCLVIATSFFEWQWLSKDGKHKLKHEIKSAEEEIFAFAGIWNHWVDKQTGELIPTYSILTVEANELMATIHNTKKRMPLVLNKADEQKWLDGISVDEIIKPAIHLTATALKDPELF